MIRTLHSLPSRRCVICHQRDGLIVQYLLCGSLFCFINTASILQGHRGIEIAIYNPSYVKRDSWKVIPFRWWNGEKTHTSKEMKVVGEKPQQSINQTIATICMDAFLAALTTVWFDTGAIFWTVYSMGIDLVFLFHLSTKPKLVATDSICWIQRSRKQTHHWHKLACI